MPVVVACFKWVVDEAYIRRGAGGALDFSSVDYKIGEYDRNAIEEAVRLRDAGGGGSVIGITVGAPESAKGVKDGLSRGMDLAFFASDPSFKDLEPSQTAAILRRGHPLAHPAVTTSSPAARGRATSYAQQVGPRLAELLGIPCVLFCPEVSPSKAESSLPTGVSRTASRSSRRRFLPW